MPLYILGPLVVVGIGLIVLIVRYAGISRAVTIENGVQAIELFHIENPHCEVNGEPVLSSDRKCALLPIDDRNVENSIGLVFAMGDRFVTRIGSAEYLSVRPKGKNHFAVHVKEFGFGALQTRFDDARRASELLQPYLHQ